MYEVPAPGFLPFANGYQVGGFRNRLLNGDFQVWQRGTSFDSTTTPANSDDTYLADRWVLISDGNDIVDVSQDTDGSFKAEVETANKQFGLVQICEATDVADLIDETVAFAIEAKASGIATLRLAVLSWTGTKDSPTSDVVGTWAGGGTEPTWAANWTREGSVVDLTLTSSFQKSKAVVAKLDASSAKQCAVVVWIDDTDADIGDTLNLRRAQLEPGGRATPFERRPVGIEKLACQRFYSRVGGADCVGGGTGTTQILFAVQYPVQMRTMPTISLVDDSPTFIDSTGAGATGSGSTIAGTAIGAKSARLLVGGFTGVTANRPYVGEQTNDLLAFDAEL